MSLLPSLTPSAVPFQLVKYLSIYSLPVTNNATTPNTKIDVGTGVCRDSTDVYDMINAASVTINAANNGLNGLDTGSLAASTLYYVHLISDPVSGLTTGAMISLSATAPLMPFGYGAFRVIGFMVTDGSTHFLKCYNSGTQNARVFTYDSPQATSVTAGTSATYAAIDLSALVPANLDNLPVLFRANWTANAAADTFNMHGGNSTGDQWSLISAVAGGTAHTVANGVVLSQLVSSVPKVEYKVSAVGGVAINVCGFAYYL
jgi:hypothetical protein